MSDHRESFKLKPTEKFISSQLLTNIIKTSNISKAVVEEPSSELWYETLNGYGQIQFKNNVKYDGFLKYGILNNENPEKPCTILFPDGTKYTGTIINNEITGEGTYTFNDGSTYIGKVVNGLRDGIGKYQSSDGILYEGEWKNGLKNGKGKIIQGNMELEGEWVKGILNGKCRIKWKSGNIFDGELANNAMNGNGYMIWYNKFEKYSGQWKNNLQCGFGIHIWYNNKQDVNFFRDRYVGQWVNGKREGYGKFYYSNGNIYEGFWKNNQKDGFGVFYYQDRTRHYGNFKNDNLIDIVNLNILNNDNKVNKSVSKIKKNSIDNSSKIDENKEINDDSKNKLLKDKKLKINKNIDEIKIPININDLLVIEPDIKQTMKEIDNLLIRNLSLISHIYMYACGKIDIKSLEMGLSLAAPLNESKNIHRKKESSSSTNNNNLFGINNIRNDDHNNMQNDEKKEKIVDYDNTYNNDLYFCLDFKNLWKLVRECGFISPEFSLAMLDRIIFQNPENEIEMYYLPEALEIKNKDKEQKEIIYDYLYQRIQKSKNDFNNKYKNAIDYCNKLNIQNNNNNKNSNNSDNEEYVPKNNYENNFDLHDEKNVILLRFFYEILIRLAYLKYNDTPEMPLATKVKNLFEFLKNFLRAKVRSGNDPTYISLPSTLIFDPKLKNIDNLMENFINNHQSILKNIFEELYNFSCGNEKAYNGFDKTLSYGFFYDNIISNSKQLEKLFDDKMDYLDLICFYFNEKTKKNILSPINDDEFNSKNDIEKIESFEYLENLLDYEMIFREFCELIFLLSRKYLSFYEIEKFEEEPVVSHSNANIKIDKKNSFKKLSLKNKPKLINDKSVDNYMVVINEIIKVKDDLIKQSKYIGVNKYVYPILKSHMTITRLKEEAKQKIIEEEKRAKEKIRYTRERKTLQEEDVNVYKEEEQDDNSGSESLSGDY